MKDREVGGVKLKGRLYPTIREEQEQRKLREQFGIPETLAAAFPLASLLRRM